MKHTAFHGSKLLLAKFRRIMALCFRTYGFAYLLLASGHISALQPEDVLGEYWTDPLFGVASAESSQRVEVLYQLLFPKVIDVFSGQTTRFIFENNSDQVHVFLFSKQPDEALKDEAFRSFVADELFHATQEIASNDGHVHSNTDSDDAKSMVGSLADRPTMTLKPFDKREIIIAFDEPSTILIRCVLDGHEELGHESVIKVRNGDFLKEKKVSP